MCSRCFEWLYWKSTNFLIFLTINPLQCSLDVNMRAWGYYTLYLCNQLPGSWKKKDGFPTHNVLGFTISNRFSCFCLMCSELNTCTLYVYYMHPSNGNVTGNSFESLNFSMCMHREVKDLSGSWNIFLFKISLLGIPVQSVGLYLIWFDEMTS